MAERLQRWRWAIAIAALMLAGLAFAFWPDAAPVDTGEVTRGPMAVGITDDGVTRAQDYYVVSAPVTGYLSRIELEACDPVARGALVATMTGRPSSPLDRRSREEARGALAAALAAENGAGAELAQARRDLLRAEQLAGEGIVSAAQLEAARTRVATGQAAQQHGRGEVQRIRALLADGGGAGSGAAVAVRAPAAGSVLNVINESEGVIAEGTPLMAIGDSRRIEVVVDLLSRDAVKVKPGDRVEIAEWGGPAPLAGRVERIEPFGRLKVSALGIEEQRVNVVIGFEEVAARLAARLGHGFQVDATIVLWRADKVLRVPIGALFRGGDGGWRVFAADGSRARERKVRIGHINDEHAEVLAGLGEGDDVVLNPGSTLVDGSRIAPR